jgi:hypothetical protein
MSPSRAARLATSVLALMLLFVALFAASRSARAAQPPVGLGTAGSFAILSYSGMTNTGDTRITGDVGSFPTASQTGFESVTLTGTNHRGDAVTRGAKDDLQTAYDDAAERMPETSKAVELGGTVLRAGVYTSGTFGLTGTLTLDAQGDPDAVFIFKTASTLITAVDSRVRLINGGDPCRVVWKVGSSATFNTGTRFVGDVLAHTSISALTGATFRGRLLALGGAVTLDTNTITNATCAAETTTTTAGSTATTSGGATSTSSTSSTTSTTTGDARTAGVPGPAGTPSTPASPGTPSTPGTPGTPGTPTGTPGSPSGTPGLPSTPKLVPGLPSTPSGAPGVPGAPWTPSETTGTPTTDRPYLPKTGAEIVGLVAVALGLLAIGIATVRAARRAREPLATTGAV